MAIHAKRYAFFFHIVFVAVAKVNMVPFFRHRLRAYRITRNNVRHVRVFCRLILSPLDRVVLYVYALVSWLSPSIA